MYLVDFAKKSFFPFDGSQTMASSNILTLGALARNSGSRRRMLIAGPSARKREINTVALEMLHSAVLDIATSRASPGDRLVHAATHHLMAIDPTTITDQESNAWLRRILGRVSPAAGGNCSCAVQQRVAELPEDEIDTLLTEIVDLFEDLTRQDANRRTQRCGTRLD